MEQATKFAETTQILMNVSEFTDVSQATDTLISSVQAFGYTAETSMEVVDLLNTIGNNYAISTADLAQSLTKSSASLVAAGGDLAEAAALTATANAIVQDADAVGTALKTTSLRLRGTDVKVLEEEGVDSDGAVTSKSKLQSKVKALSGVDILTETGDYKSTYQILSQIADVWEDISNMDQAALLEMLAGKRNASVLAAILQAPEELKAAYEDAANAEGSALSENEKYLDSIQGRIDQFNNSVQSLWSHILDDDMVKGIVSWVTQIIKSLDTTKGKVLAIVKAVAILAAYKKVNPLDWITKFNNISNAIKTDGLKSYIMSLFQVSAAQKTVTADTLVSTIAQEQNNIATQQQIVSKLGLTNITGALTAAQKLQAAQELVSLFNGGMISKDLATRMAAMLGYKFSVDATKTATIALDTTTKSFMASNPIGWILLIVSAIMSVVMWIANTESSIEKLEGKLDDLNSEISDIKSELDSLNSELETTQDRMEELLSMSSLSFTEAEELKTLKLQNAELERRIKLEEMMLKSKEEERKNTAKDVIASNWDSVKLDKKYAVTSGVIKEDGFWDDGKNTKDALNEAMSAYKNKKDLYNTMSNALINWDSLNDYDKYALTIKNDPSLGDLVEEENWVKAAHFNQIASKEDIEKWKKAAEDNMGDISGSINTVFKDMSDIISKNGLSYSMGDEEINKFLDEYYAYSIKWANAQGTASKSSVISAIWDNTESEAMAGLKEELDEIAKSDSADKQVEAQKIIQDALKDTTGQYERLQTFMGTVGVTAKEMADYFVAASDAPDISTIEGMTAVYQDGVNILGKYKNARNEVFGQDENGEDVTWNKLFTKDETTGKMTADKLKIASVLEGSDEAMREEFTKMVEAVENGEMEVNEALAKWNISGFDRILDNLNNEFEGLNNEIFPNIADDINGLIDTVGELKSALEDVASTIDLLSAAEEQMANSGQISVKTALELMETTDDYNKVVTVENGVLKLAKGAQDHLTQAKFNSIKVQLEAAATLAESTYQTALASQSELDYADNANVVMTAESIKAEAVGRVSAVVVALGAAMDEITKGNWGSAFSAFGNTYKDATATVVAQSNAMKTSIAELERDAKNKRALADVYSFADDYESFKDNYDFDKTPGDKYDDNSAAEDKFQKAMDYWENRIAANQARYEQLQNEIDLLESKGQKADASYYEEQIKLENERLSLLQQQKAEAESFLGTFKEGSEEWWSVAETLNSIESELDSVTQSIVDLQDAIAEIDTYKFEEFNTRLDNLVSKLETIRDLISPDGEEDWFDDEGNWTEAGVAVLGSQVQQLELYKQGLEETEAELKKYNKAYSNNTKAYYEGLGIHSEQEYYEKVEELTEQQYDLAESISDTEQSIVDMYESNIDAVEEYIETLIDGYNDYIDSIKEALDAERDLYEFKKNVQKQAKDIAELERRIASLSGSTNKSEIAERRKLEAQLYEARESLNDTYYDHAKDAQNDALDAEQSAYEETMNKFIEGLRIGLETATRNMDEFLMSVTGMVTLNADIVLSKYQETELPLGDAITNPWEAAKKAVGDYSGDALDLMNQWTQNGFLTTFPGTVSKSLSSPWTAGTSAAGAFKTSVSKVMSNVVSNISTNVKTASGELSKLYQQIKDTEKRAASANVTPSNGSGGGSGNGGAGGGGGGGITKTAILKSSGKEFTYTKTEKTESEAKRIAKDGVIQKAYDYYKGQGKDDSWLDRKYSSWSKSVTYRAKGTTGTTRDEWAITDEPQFGDELVLVPGKDGNLSFMRKGTGVVPADMTQKLFELAQIPTSDLMNKNLTAIVPNITKNDFKNEFNFESLVHVDTVDSDTLPKLEKMVDKKIDDFSKSLNYSLKKFTR